MKPRNFIVNIMLTLLSIFLIIGVCFGTQIPLPTLFIGVGTILILIPEWILKPKHRAFYLVYKGVAQVLFTALIIISVLLGFLFVIIFEVQNDLSQNCNSTISHSEMDEFLATYLMLYAIPILTRIIMNIVDFATYRKERRKDN